MPTTINHNLLSLEQFAEQSPAITRRMLAYWLQCNRDGFREKCAVKVGQRVLLDTAAVAVWLEGHRQGKKGHPSVPPE